MITNNTPEPASSYIPSGAARLYYELSGQGEPIVFIHAAVADCRQWNHEFAHFSQDHQVLRYDMRGSGQSLPVAGQFRPIDDLTTLLDALGIDRPLVLVGCSMGGGLAMDFALAYPSRVKALVMVGSAPFGLYLDVPEDPKEADYMKAYEAGDLDLAAELATQIWFDGMGRTPEQVDPETRQLALEMNRLAAVHNSMNNENTLPNAAIPAAQRLDELHIPVLVIVGEFDAPYLPAAADYMVEHIPTARKVVLEDAAHLANMDHPARFQRAVQDFLTSVASG
jgi:3-oxoadipate enol-lactonase